MASIARPRIDITKGEGKPVPRKNEGKATSTTDEKKEAKNLMMTILKAGSQRPAVPPVKSILILGR